MKKISLQEWVYKIQSVVLRFTFPVFFILGLSVLFFIQINQNDADIKERLWIFFGLAIPLSIALTLFSEEFKNKILRVGINLSGTAILAIYAFTLPEKLFEFHYYQVFTFGIAFVLCSFVVSFFRKENDISFWEFSKTTVLQLIISSVFCQVLMMGLSLAVLSLDKLFNINISEKVYGNIAVICYAVFAPVYFLANVPDEIEKHKQEFKYDKFLKILGLYIMLPILALYTIILYVYAIRIVAKWELPNGWVTWLVSVLALGGFLCMMIVYPLRLQTNKIAVFVSRFFPVILLPLLILMTVGIFRRLDDYGLTINRAYVFLLNFWLYGICIYLFLSHSKQLKWIFITFSAIAFLSAIGPWSVFRVTKNNMLNQIEVLLSENNYLKDGKIIQQSDIKSLQTDKKAKELLSAKVDYLVKNFGSEAIQPLFSDDVKDLTAFKILNRMNLETNYMFSGDKKFYNIQQNKETKSIDIQLYSKMFTLELQNKKFVLNDSIYNISFENEVIIILNKNSNKVYGRISLKEKLAELTKKEDLQEFAQEQLTIEKDNIKLIIETINAQRKNNDSLEITDFKAILLIK
jgi:MFS family permease